MEFWGMTDVGMVRTENQDKFLIFSQPEKCYNLLLICDGMGGANGGSVASALAADSFSSYIAQKAIKSMTRAQMAMIIQEAANQANKIVFEAALKDSELAGMGTTLVCMLEINGSVVVGNIGDSRAYFADCDGMIQITKDHSLVAEMVLRGELTAASAARHPNKNVITRALGVDSAVVCDTFDVDVKSGEFILLCSDGLTNEVSEPEMYYEVYQSQMTASVCKTLIEIAKARGGHDNITVVLASF